MVAVTFAVLAATSLSATGATPGSVDQSFKPGRGALGVEGGRGRTALLQSDGKIIVGGEFNSFHLTSVPPVIRLHPDGSLDQQFDASGIKRAPLSIVDGEVMFVYPIALQNGLTIVGGRFDLATGERRALIRLLAGGARDTTFKPSFATLSSEETPSVRQAVVQPDGKILVAGTFDSVNGVPGSFLARLNEDGSTDATFRPTVNGRAEAFALQNDGKIVVGFGSASVVRLNSNGTLDPTFTYGGPQPSWETDIEKILIQPDGRMIVSGSYEEFGTLHVTFTARVNADGSADESYPLLNGAAIAMDADGRLFLNSDTHPFGLQRLLMDGKVDTTFEPPPGIAASWIVEQPDQRLIVAGGADGGIQRLLSNGAADQSFGTGAGLTYVGNVGTRAILLPTGKIVVYGNFNFFDGIPRTKVARLNGDGSLDQTFDPGDLLYEPFFDFEPHAVVAQGDGKILVAYNEELVRLDETGAVDPTFHYFAAGERAITAMAVDSDGKLLAGIDSGLVRMERNGELDGSFNAALPQGYVSRIIPQADGKVVISHAERVHRLNYDGSADQGFTSFGAPVLSLLAIQPDGKILINRYQNFGYELLRFNADGTQDSSFHPMKNAHPLQAVADGDGIYVAGGVEPRQSDPLTAYEPGVRRLHRDGLHDATFDVELPATASVKSLLVQVDGRVVVAGDFLRVNGIARHGIARLIGTAPDKIANISTRVRVGRGDAAEIGGFIVTGQEPKTVVIRGLGPSLPLAQTLSNPVLDIYNSSGEVIAHNDNWRQSQEAEIVATGVAPLRDAETAVVITLDPGAYTALLRGAAGGEGIGMIEVYDVDAAAASRLANISTRGMVRRDDNVMIGGFILRGGENASIAIRALGPSLAKRGVAGSLQDPVLQLHDQSGVLVATNDNWRDEQAPAITAANLAPTDDREAALIATLAPGAYTAIVRPARGAAGLGLLEVYDLR